MDEFGEGRLAKLRQRYPCLVAVGDRTILNAFCIDLFHGGAYAWAYLAKMQVPPDDIAKILLADGKSWHYLVQDIGQDASHALASMGLTLPREVRDSGLIGHASVDNGFHTPR